MSLKYKRLRDGDLLWEYCFLLAFCSVVLTAAKTSQICINNSVKKVLRTLQIASVNYAIHKCLSFF